MFVRSTLKTWIALVACCGCLWVGRAGAEELTPEQVALAKRQIIQLNAPDNVAREEAETYLLHQGTAVLPLVKEALTNPNAEIAARARRLVSKLTEATLHPASSYAEVLPENTIFFAEFSNLRQTLQRLQTSPLGQFINLPAFQKFLTAYQAAQGPGDEQLLEAVRRIFPVLEGRGLVALGPPDTIEANELDPPFVYVLESKQGDALEAQVRTIFSAQEDPPKQSHQYGPFTVEEHLTSHSVFGLQSVIHGATQLGTERFLDVLLKHPLLPLQPSLAEIRSRLPNYDWTLHFSRQGLNELSDAGDLVDDSQLAVLDKLGFAGKSVYQSVAAVNADGIEEHVRVKLGGGEKDESLLGVFQKMGADLPPAPAAGVAQALDLIPMQASLLVSFNGDTAKYSSQLVRALNSLDSLSEPEVAMPAKPVPAPRTQVDANKTPGKTAGQAELDLKDGKANEPQAPQAEAPVGPHLAKWERAGLKLDQWLAQIDGPVQLALFMESIGTEAPTELPMSAVLALQLKDPKVLAAAFDALSGGADALFKKDAFDGGWRYIEVNNEESKAGFWLKGNNLAYATDSQLLELAAVALKHQAGNERWADRTWVKQLNQGANNPALLTVVGEAAQVLEMPYVLSKLNWQDDDANPWPDYTLIRPLLSGRSIRLQISSAKDGLTAQAQTPFSLIGLVQAFWRPLGEAGF